MTTVIFTKLNSEEKDEQEPPFSPLEKTAVPLFGKPKEIGHFSIDSDRSIRFDTSKMKYLISSLRTRNVCLDLNVNFNTDVFHQYVTLDKMYQILYWLLYNQGNIHDSSQRHVLKGIDFVTVRGTLMLISCTPYIKGHYRNQWEICASKFSGTIYFSAIDSDIDIEENRNLSHRQALFQSWGYKFEQYMTTDIINGECNLSSRTFQLEEYCVILKNILNEHTLLYKAEIDAVIPNRYPVPGSGNTSCYTELKTSKIIQGEIQNYKFHRHKLVTWWAQSFLAGIPEIICGFRNDEGIVKNLEIFSVSTLPQKALGLWSPDACLNFCEKFLKFLKRTVTEDDPSVVYKFHYKGGEVIYCSKLIHPVSRYRVIPDWYVKGMKG